MDSLSEGVQGFVVRFHKCMQDVQKLEVINHIAAPLVHLYGHMSPRCTHKGQFREFWDIYEDITKLLFLHLRMMTKHRRAIVLVDDEIAELPFAAVRNVVEADRRVTIDEIMIRLPPGLDIGRY
ncbi:hypothetical protein LAZ67_1005959 [Cordylochernes scorpioides]|uniref:Uncharacterized protein n=1 Tax=Cordylochernes scorpioides TaxID=51811 RepID=A0ABY6JYU4_9ARAC|nr:hypothetical protein LAZ67_1005959 [Cordylochernes scorpioides]